MDAAELRRVIAGGLPRGKVMLLARELKVVERQSIIDIEELVNALVLSARTPAGGRQADVLRIYLENVTQQPVRGTFYARFNEQLELLLERLLAQCLERVARDRVLLPTCLQGVKDWIIVDSETIRLHKSLEGLYPSTSAGVAAVKVHKSFSLGRHNLLKYALSPARHSDSKYLTVTEADRGYGFLVDMAYASRKFMSACQAHGVSFVVRLKAATRASISAVHTGQVARLVRGGDFAEELAAGRIGLADGAFDADVVMGNSMADVHVRLVALEVPGKGLCTYLTNLSREKYPVTVVGDAYRLRWEIEKSNKLDKSDFSIDEVDARKPCSARTMLLASLLGSTLVNSLVHLDHCARVDAVEPPRHGPIHARLLAMALAVANASISMLLRTQANAEGWQRLANTLDHSTRDPNWRRRPSVLDRLFGFASPTGPPLPLPDR